MTHIKEYIKRHFNSLFKFDKKRIFDLIDIFQNTLVTFFSNIPCNKIYK